MFWRRKTLNQMSSTEWESLCDGCGKCCLHKLEDIDDGRLHYTNVACHLLDLKSCRCTRYTQRHRWVSDCVRLRPENVSEFKWLPSSCAYRLLAEDQDLPVWHPLISGDSDSVNQVGVSVRGWAVSEQQVTDIEEHVIEGSL